MQGDIQVTAIITTRNEERNLARCLKSLQRFCEIIVVDSNSTDNTKAVADSFAARWVDYHWNGRYPKKRQWCLDTLTLKSDRVFFIDADEEASAELCDEIAALDWSSPGYFVRGHYVVDGRVLKFGMPNKKLCLFDRRYYAFPEVNDLHLEGMGEIEGHYQPVRRDGLKRSIPTLRHAVRHHALDDMDRYEERHAEYALWRKGMDTQKLHPEDPVPIRQYIKAVFAFIGVKHMILFVYFYIVRLGFLEFPANLDIYRQKLRYYNISK